MVQETPHSRSIHNEAKFILQNPDRYGDIWKAWAFWVQTNMSFTSKLFGGFAYARKSDSCEKKSWNCRINFSTDIRDRLEKVQIECTDALKVISSRDMETSFFYQDPPYYNSDLGHYGGYMKEDFEKLLEINTKLKGKFLLSSYESDVLERYTRENNWYTIKIIKRLTCNIKVNRTKVEVLTSNYPISLPE